MEHDFTKCLQLSLSECKITCGLTPLDLHHHLVPALLGQLEDVYFTKEKRKAVSQAQSIYIS